MSDQNTNSDVPSVSSSDLPNILKADPSYIEDLKDKLDKGEITEEQMLKIQQFFVENQYGPVQQSILCKGLDCPFAKSCPLVRAKLPLPLNKPCPIEESTRTLWFQQLAKELGTVDDGFDATDLGVACDIVNILLQKQRVQWELADNPKVSQQTVVGMNQGQPIVDNKANPAFFALKALNQMQLKLSESLLTTREARSKDQSRKTQDAATQYAALQEIIGRTKQLRQTNSDGSPVPIFDLISNLPENKSSDDIINIDEKTEEEED